MNDSIEVGIDEVGRGCIFGPVFSSVVVLTLENKYLLKKLGIDDSKKLSAKKRNLLLPKILELSKDWGIGQSSVREIEKYGIRHATELSMMRAIYKLKSKPLKIYVDGKLPLSLWKGKQVNVIKGDSKLTSIAAASILAKVKRDSLMIRLEEKYKGYIIYNNKGYGTNEHFLSINNLGITNLHRKSFIKGLDLIQFAPSCKILN
tara:strand:- start:195 stop:806 length:612 start_codon:yes stop_codon:yes gene_type:complete